MPLNVLAEHFTQERGIHKEAIVTMMLPHNLTEKRFYERAKKEKKKEVRHSCCCVPTWPETKAYLVTTRPRLRTH